MCHDTGCSIPYGYCHCGCGQYTRIAKTTRRQDGWRCGVPVRYKHGHNRTKHDARDFWKDVHKGPACWEWCKYKIPSGYGQVGWQGKVQLAHRVAWVLTYGPIPDGFGVLHRCDNPPCCNPEHLFLGTHQENMEDMVSKGRHLAKYKLMRVGEKHPNAKLTDATVKLIREVCSEHPCEYTRLSRYFGVAPNTIGDILRGKNWRHVR